MQAVVIYKLGITIIQVELNLPAKLDRCVDKVKAKGDDVNAFAVCNSKIEELASEGRDIYQNHMKEMDVPSILQEDHSPLDIVNGELEEAVAVSNDLSNLDIGDKREREIGIILGASR